MPKIPEFLERGDIARLIPAMKDSQREDRACSIFLAGFMAVDEFACALLGGIGTRLGRRANVSCYTQVIFKNLPSDIKNRPDGLIEIATGSKRWYAIVEAKIGTAELTEEQIRDYMQVSKINGIAAVITISNQFATLPTHHPVKLSRALPRGVVLYYWSWMHVVTQAILLLQSAEFRSTDRRYLLQEIVRYFRHESVGISGFLSMNSEWKDVVAKVQTGAPLSKSSDEVIATVASWHQESRDLCLIMTRDLGRNVRLKLSRAHAKDPAPRLKDDCEALTKSHRLTAELDVPDAASPISVVVDLQRRTVRCSMRLAAPEDKQRATARTNWLLRQLKQTRADEVFINALWIGRARQTQETLSELRNDPRLLETGKVGAPTAFEVVMVRGLGAKFGGRRTFIDNMELIVPEFYQEVGQYLRAWIPRPPTSKSKLEIEAEPGQDVSQDARSKETVSGDQSTAENAGSKKPDSHLKSWFEILQDDVEHRGRSENLADAE